MAYDFALARITPAPVCWNLYDTAEQAAADLAEANARAARYGEPPYQPMTYAEFAEAKRAHYLAPERNPLTEITAERYDEMLNVLPPMYWQEADGVVRFCMSEMLDDSITEQFARHGDRFWFRRVDVRDRATWITAAEIAKHLAA